MPKKASFEYALSPWLGYLTFQMQALLLTGMRGPDGMDKHNMGKFIVRYLRGVVIKPAGNWQGMNSNDFMWGEYEKFPDYAKAFFDDHDAYPHHFLMHLIHCAQVVGYKHPSKYIRDHWFTFYAMACESFHMTAETEEEMDKRLNDFK